MLLLCVVYLVISSMNNLAPVTSRVICWASAWNKPVLCAVVSVYLAWTLCGQAQQMWASIWALIHRQALYPRFATGTDSKTWSSQSITCFLEH